MAFGVPVKVIVAELPVQIVAFAEIAATGNGTTFTVTLPVAGWVQLGVPGAVTLTSVKVVVDV